LKSIKSKATIVIISLFVGLLHFVIGPGYQGVFKEFISGYLIDIVLPFNMYLLLQISLRKKISVMRSRISGSIAVFLFGVTIELLQKFEIPVFGSTYDPLDFVMYGLGVFLGLVFDLIVIERFEKNVCPPEME